jgi:hypothetical protein
MVKIIAAQKPLTTNATEKQRHVKIVHGNIKSDKKTYEVQNDDKNQKNSN